jgi:hypothetical protein
MEQPAQSLGVELRSLRFHEGDIREYTDEYRTTRFPQETTRYVNFELSLNNLFYQERDQEFHRLVRYYHPDGSLLWEGHRDVVLPSGDKDFYESTGWGWKESGNWTQGIYQVEIFIDGVKIVESPFSVIHRVDIIMDMFGYSVAHLGWEKGEYTEGTRTWVLDTDWVVSIEACTLTDVPTTAVTCKDRMVFILFGTPEEIKRKLHLQE